MNILEIRTQHVKHRRLNIEAGVQIHHPFCMGMPGEGGGGGVVEASI